jgi:protein SCO1/2
MPSSVETCLHVLAVLGALHLGACKGEELPRLGAVPELSLTDHRGAALTATSLRGRPWIANFIFTRCPDVCPLLTGKLAGVRSRLVADRVWLRYVSFSVDP